MMIQITGEKHGTSFEACAETTRIKTIPPSMEFLLSLK